MKETENNSTIISLLLGLVLLFGGMLVCAFLLSGGTIPAAGERITAYLCLSVSCFAAAFAGARGASSRKLLFGIVPVMLLDLCLLILAVCWRGREIVPVSAAMVSGICLLSAVLGALPGTLLRAKRKY